MPTPAETAALPSIVRPLGGLKAAANYVVEYAKWTSNTVIKEHHAWRVTQLGPRQYTAAQRILNLSEVTTNSVTPVLHETIKTRDDLEPSFDGVIIPATVDITYKGSLHGSGTARLVFVIPDPRIDNSRPMFLRDQHLLADTLDLPRRHRPPEDENYAYRLPIAMLVGYPDAFQWSTEWLPDINNNLQIGAEIMPLDIHPRQSA